MSKRKVKVDGEEFEVELEKEDGVWNVTVQGKKFQIEIEGGAAAEQGVKKRKRGGRGKKSGTISSTIPGKIVSIAISEGQQVSEGDVVMILEAMKMQNEIHAPLSGTVSAVNCKPGDSVEANSPLVVITPEEDKTD
jgi:biotin carboxyl carrier protein